jgi:Zn ribbon nucleic-acid-binding protein
MTRDLPNALHLAGLNCNKCAASDTCTIVVAPRGLFIATCTKCRYTTAATRKTHELLAMYAFGEKPSEGA